MLRIGVCDDEERARSLLKFLLLQVLDESGREQTVYEFSSGEGAVNWLRKHPGTIDLLFLDIEMGGMSGMDAARAIRRFDGELMLVFVTGYADYVFDGYGVEALDYLVKPVKRDKLDQVLRRAAARLVIREDRVYTLQNSDGVYRIPLDHIRYAYSEGHRVHIVTESREYATYGKLDELEARLAGDFVRIHQRYLVSAGAVEAIEGGHVLVAGQKLPMSRALRGQAMERFLTWGEGGK